MRPLDSILKSALPQREVLRQARANKTLRRWNEVVGETLATKSWPERYEQGTIHVCVQGSSWLLELSLRKEQILDKLAVLSGEPGLFKDLRFTDKALPSPPPPPPPQRTRRGVTQTIEEIRQKWFGEGSDEEGA